MVYRIQRTETKDNIFKNSISWSLYPRDHFCGSKECHLYVTRIPENLKVIYIDNHSKDKNLSVFDDFHNYEFEFILPRNINSKKKKRDF